MNENPNRIACPKCGAANFPSSTNCWQCGESLRVRQIHVERTEPESTPPGSEPPPGTPPPPAPSSPVYIPPGSRQDTDTLVIIGFMLAGLGLFGCCCCCSPLLSVAAIVLGAMAYSRGDNRGLWVIIAGAAALILGIVIPLVTAPFQQFRGPWRNFPGPIPGPWRNI